MISCWYQELDEIDVTGGQQEDEQPEEDKITRGFAEGFPVVGGFSVACKNKGFEGVTEGLGEHHHDDGDFKVLPVNAKLVKGVCLFGIGVGIDQREKDFIDRLV